MGSAIIEQRGTMERGSDIINGVMYSSGRKSITDERSNIIERKGVIKLKE